MEYLKIFTDFARSMEPLDDAERGRLFTAMLAYAERGEVANLPGNERFVWPTARLHIDREAVYMEERRRSPHPRAAHPHTRSNTKPSSSEIADLGRRRKEKHT